VTPTEKKNVKEVVSSVNPEFSFLVNNCGVKSNGGYDLDLVQPKETLKSCEMQKHFDTVWLNRIL